MKKWLPLIARILLGLVFVASGVMAFATKFAIPPNLPENLAAFSKGLAASTYFMPLLKGTEALCGLLLLSGAFVPLALVVLAPIILNITLTNIFLVPSGVPLAAVLIFLEIYLAFFASPYKNVIRPLFRSNKKTA
jgi:uncharacterized membrane protein YphA (DoxX/SURF4 family)